MRHALSPARLGVVGTAAALLVLPLATQAFAATSVTQDKLTPTTMTAGVAGSAKLTVHSSSCFTAKTLGVGVRDASGNNLDFPGNASNVRICPSGAHFTSAPRTLPAGTYTIFGFWQESGGAWHDLPSHKLTVSKAPSTTTPPSSTPSPSTDSGDSPTAGRSVVWSDDFSGGIAWNSKWVGGKSTSYAYGDHNPDDNKLDWLDPGAVTTSGGIATFTAKPSSHTLESGKKAWTTGLLTTEGSSEGFQVKTGDYAETRVKLPSGSGAWPALWTWKDGNGEIDSFEYHPDNPDLLELTNHVTSGSDYYTDSGAIAPGQWVTIGTRYGADSVDWYVNGKKVYSDGHGVGSGFSAYPILNLSVSAGQYHPAPTGSTPITMQADYVKVYR
ncbi:glycoside hydrolase family 16 protein [Streptomyces sp. NBC_00078]|uniref:glycoside hydrolase family 16 protein n=1 Tax=unclassified Streptomyces TaxID=2593676 RepID=UPI00225173CC|nr:glycoside hydrolase family 16 protein [Streptomyces sp. NBC_00078]MCX5418622.1 glycoside hydrolase family 16 protein [Streptomyces sp. NBC_00078]